MVGCGGIWEIIYHSLAESKETQQPFLKCRAKNKKRKKAGLTLSKGNKTPGSPAS